MPTPLQKRVYDALKMIPRGKVTTYGAIARYLNTRAVRAVATAVGKNPDAPSVPCHRVVLADGRVGNYSGSGGVATKTELLTEEGITVRAGRIVAFEAHLYTFENESC